MKPNFKGLVNVVQKNVVKHSPQILTGMGVAGMITTTVLAVKATPKALQLIEEEKEIKDVAKLTKAETVKATWKCYIPAAVTGGLSIICLVGATSIGTKRTAALATAYKISEAALQDYKNAVVETIGEEKEKEVKEKVAEKRIVKAESQGDVYIHKTNGGDELFYDPYIDRQFTSSVEFIENEVNKLNADMINGYDSMSLNTFYAAIGLPRCDVGDIVGWDVYGGRNGIINVNLSNSVVINNKAYILLEFENTPKYEFAD